VYPLLAQWKPAGDKIKTSWADKIDINKVLPEYPRPIMERDEWQNLNGLWNYAILPAGKSAPQTYDGKILVPFALESSLSGVAKQLGDKNELWYQREFTVPAKWDKKKIILNFGAVDWKADVWVNNIKVGQHTGGYTPFSLDITSALIKGITN
jgi:Beta-galactosidase/beta-glucuronidase